MHVCGSSCVLWYLHIKRLLNVLNFYLFICAFSFLIGCLIRKYFAFKYTHTHTLKFLIVFMTGVQNATKLIRKCVLLLKFACCAPIRSTYDGLAGSILANTFAKCIVYLNIFFICIQGKLWYHFALILKVVVASVI